jgi:hypothetical protein
MHAKWKDMHANERNMKGHECTLEWTWKEYDSSISFYFIYIHIILFIAYQPWDAVCIFFKVILYCRQADVPLAFIAIQSNATHNIYYIYIFYITIYSKAFDIYIIFTHMVPPPKPLSITPFIQCTFPANIMSLWTGSRASQLQKHTSRSARQVAARVTDRYGWIMMNTVSSIYIYICIVYIYIQYMYRL